MKNTTNYSTKVKPPTKDDIRREIDFELKLFTEIPVTEEHAMKLLDSLLFMTQADPEMMSLIAWREKHGLTERKVCEFKDKYPLFAERYAEIKERIAWRRLDKAAERKHDASITKYVMPYFSETFKNLEEWRMKTKATEKSQAQIVVIEKFPSSDLVPPREEQE